MSWVREFAQDWAYASPGSYQRRSVDKLVRKLDVDIPPHNDDHGHAGASALGEGRVVRSRRRKHGVS